MTRILIADTCGLERYTVAEGTPDNHIVLGAFYDKAEAQLHLAARDMLEALKSAHHMLTRDAIDAAKMDVIEKCDAAIEKAKGQS